MQHYIIIGSDYVRIAERHDYTHHFVIKGSSKEISAANVVLHCNDIGEVTVIKDRYETVIRS